MIGQIDETHDPERVSWVESAWGHDQFPLQNLPLGTIRADDGSTEVGVRIGDDVLRLRAAIAEGLIDGASEPLIQATSASDLAGFLSLSLSQRQAFRRLLVDVLDAKTAPRRVLDTAVRGRVLLEASACRMMLPARIGDFTDFYAGIHHAKAVGSLFRPDAPLKPNYKYVPVGYNGRASSVLPSHVSVRRPAGQIKLSDRTAPSFLPTRRLDYELEVGVWIADNNALGSPVPVDVAGDRVAGLCLLNDLSARDIQAWEYEPLGPFLSKGFATVISPWLVTTEALAPFRVAQTPRPADDPSPLPHLDNAADQAGGAFDIDLTAYLATVAMRERDLKPTIVCKTNSRHLYWTVAQLIAHHTSNGCNLRSGDLLGSGTISSLGEGGSGSFLEATLGGARPIDLASGERRTFLEDGDTITIAATCRREGFAPVGFGECVVTIAA